MRYYEDATFGNLVGAIKKMSDIADAYDGEAGFIVYYSGLGAVDEKTKERYLLPSDASLASLSSTGYSVQALQKNLETMKTVYTLAIFDAPFSNIDKEGKALKASRGVAIAPQKVSTGGNVVICMGSGNEETSYSSKKYGHGLLTFALLKELQSTRGNCSMKELLNSAVSWVSKESLNLYDKMQTPLIEMSVEMKSKWNNLKF